MMMMRIRALLLIAIRAIASAEGAAQRPNIIVILADDLGFRDVGWHGSEIHTPVLDGLAKSGIDLSQWHGHSICTPSRSALMTGRYAFHTGMQHSYLVQGAPVGLPLNITTIADGLKKAGYSTHMIGKWHLGFTSWEYTPLERGFDTYFGYLGGGEDYYTHESGGYVDLRDDCNIAHEDGNYSATVFVNRAIQQLQQLTGEVPFFLYLAFQSVHSPIEAPPNYTGKYPEIQNKKRRTMAQMVSAMDDEIGRLVAAVQHLGAWENTLLFFAADNGGPPYVANSNWPLRGGKWTMWQGGAHVAAFVTHGNSKVFGGLHQFPFLAHHMDLLPTLFAAAGIDEQLTMDQCGDGEKLSGQCCPGADILPKGLQNVTEEECCAACLNNTECAGYTYRKQEKGCWIKMLISTCEPSDECSSWKRSKPQPSPFPPCPNRIDGTNLWPYWTQQRSSEELRNRSLVLNVDQTNTRAGIYDAGGWAGYAGIHTLEWKLMLGDGGTPSGLCWPPNGDIGNGTCSYSGHVPKDLDTPHLYHLSVDPSESVDVVTQHPDIVAKLSEELNKFIHSACQPLNMFPAGRKAAAAAKAAARANAAWTPWEKCATKHCRCEPADTDIELTV